MQNVLVFLQKNCIIVPWLTREQVYQWRCKWTYLSGVLPGDSGKTFNGNSAKSAKHGPPSMYQLAFSEPLDPKNFGVWLKRRRLDLPRVLNDPNDVTATFLARFWSSPSKSNWRYSAGLPKPNRSKPRSPLIIDPSSHSAGLRQGTILVGHRRLGPALIS